MLEAEHKLKLLIKDRPWETEPDHKEWVEPTTKYKCEIRRNPVTLTLLGYVTVPKTSHYYGLSYNNVVANVHGGLTYSNKGEFGFDCAHAGDLCPGLLVSVLKSSKDPSDYTALTLEHDTYRTFKWVVDETESLATCLWQMNEDLEEVLIMQAAQAAVRKSGRVPESVPERVAQEYAKAKAHWLKSLGEN